MRFKTALMLLLLLPAGRVAAQVPISEKDISLEEVEVKPRKAKVWTQKGRPWILPFSIGGFHVWMTDSAGKQQAPIACLNRIEAFSKHKIHIVSVETKMNPFDNDSFDVFFFVMQVAEGDTLVQRKLIIGKDIKKHSYTLTFKEGELTLLPQTAYVGLEFVPRKISSFYDYQLRNLHTQNMDDLFYIFLLQSSQLVPIHGYGSAFTLSMRYYEVL